MAEEGESNHCEKEGAMEVNLENNSDMELVSPGEIDGEFNGNSDIPAQVEKHLDFLAVNSLGHILLGSSNLAGRYWCGSIWYYDDPKLVPGVVESKAGKELFGGVADGIFLTDTTAVIGQDGGEVNFISINSRDNRVHMSVTAHAEDHSNTVLSVKATCDNKQVITSSLDKSICLWDSKTTVLSHSYSPAHSQEVTCVDPHPSNSNLFLSASLDGNVLFWDIRCPKPASCVYRDYNDAPTTVAWLTDCDGTGGSYLVGTQSGSVRLRKTSVLTHDLTVNEDFKRPVYRLVPNSNKRDQIVACANESRIIVYNVEGETIRIRYENDQHKDFVRGLAWLDDSSIISCGWDKASFVHCL